jgi:hypothetical protein
MNRMSPPLLLMLVVATASYSGWLQERQFRRCKRRRLERCGHSQYRDRPEDRHNARCCSTKDVAALDKLGRTTSRSSTFEVSC